MTDLDTTEILTADESLTENSSTNDTKASLTIISGTDPNIYQINKETIIGRSTPSDIIIVAPSLSKQHAKLTINNGQYFLTDLGSSNKTFHNKIQLQSNVCYALHDGDEIKFGDVVCSFQEEKQAKIDPNPSTQSITNSYDDQEPTQPMKVWNKNTNSIDVTPKQNGVNESPNKSSSSFIPHSSLSTTNDDNDNNLIIGSTAATIPVVVESKEMNNDDDQNESKEDSPPSVNELMITDNSKLNDEDENITDNTANQESVKAPSSEEQMDTDQTTESPAMVIDEKQSENANEMEEEDAPTTDPDVMPVDESSAVIEQEAISNVNKSVTESEKKIDESGIDVPEEEELESPVDVKEEIEESAPVSGRGVARRNVPRARGRRRGAAARARVVSTRLHGGRRHAIVPPEVKDEGNNTTLEETVNTETEESPKKLNIISEIKEKKPAVTPNKETNTGSNVRISARIKERATSGRTRQFPYTDDYVDLDDIEKQSKTTTTTTTTTPTGRKSNRGRPSSSPQKRISLRQQPIDASENSEQKDNENIYEQIDTVVENKEPTPKTAGRKRKSTTPISTNTTKRTRPTTPQTVPTKSSRRKQTSTIEQSPTVAKPNRRTTGGHEQQQPATTVTVPTPKRGRKSTKLATSIEQSPEKQSSATDRPVRIALSSHLNFDQNHLDTLRKLGFEIMDESCHVDALVVDRIRRTKKFFMCLARGAHILSPTWIDSMIKENRYIPYDKYYLEDTNAETRYGFQLRESVRLAKQGPIFENKKFFCTKDTSPPYDDLKDIIEAAGGKLIDKINMTKPGKDIICIVGQTHKNEFEDLFKKGVSIVSEEFILSGISKQKLDFDAFSLFQNATTVKPNIGK